MTTTITHHSNGVTVERADIAVTINDDGTDVFMSECLITHLVNDPDPTVFIDQILGEVRESLLKTMAVAMGGKQ
jgi:hypothetical protein